MIPLEYYNWCKRWAMESFKVLVPGASVFIFAGRRYAHRCIAAFEDSGFIFKDMLAWEKEQAAHRAQRVSVVYKKEETWLMRKNGMDGNLEICAHHLNLFYGLLNRTN